MSYRVLFLCLVLLAHPAGGTAFGQTGVDVSVTGVEGRLRENIMARLRIALFSRDSELNEAEIRRLHRLAPEDIESALRPYGYYQSDVSPSLQQIGDAWQATYAVDPGPQVHISSIEVSVAGAAAELEEFANPLAFLELREGDALEQPRYETGKRDLLRRARSLGFLDADYTVHEIRIDLQRHEAAIELVLDSGPRYRFGEVRSTQTVIDDDLLKRFMPFDPGDYYISGKLFDLQRDLYRTDYFSTVVVEPETEEIDGLEVPVSVDLQPRDHYNRYSFGVGYSTDTKAHVRFEWQNRLLNRSGHRTSTSVLVGEQQSHLVLGYRIPGADPRFDTLALSALWNREEWEETITSMLSAGLAYEYSTPTRFLNFSVEVLDEDYRVGDTKGTSMLVMPGVQGSLALADDIVNTENGLRASVAVSGASETLFSDASFLKVRADGKLILSPIEKYRLIGRGSAGAVLVDSIDDIPPSLRFYAGGDRSVRGYRYRTLGPVDSSGTVIGGRFLLTGSVELERQLAKFWRAAVFYDVGNAMNDIEVDLVHGIGIGVGVTLPFGQARLDLAYPLQDEGSSQFIFISVGADL